MRLDLFLTEKRAMSRTRAANIIKLGGVFVNGVCVKKPSADVTEQDDVIVKDVIGYASLAGLKLKHALDYFGLKDFSVCVDIGASNGGFTSCLLAEGAKKVYAVDVGECAFSEELKNDSRIIVMDNTNARSLVPSDFAVTPDFAVCDVSFISVTLLANTIYKILSENGRAVVLVKPQFEVGAKNLGKSGMVVNPRVREKALESVAESFKTVGFVLDGITEIPRLFDNKNIEYLMCLHK